MKRAPSFPKSFPNVAECAFLELLFCADDVLTEKLDAWTTSTVFDDLDYATARLLPLLYLRLCARSIEHPLKGKMQGFYKLAWVKNQRLLASAREALRLLEGNDIPVLLVKGIPLVLDTYRDMGARFMGDADLFIHPRNAKKAVALMQQHEWRFANPYTPLPQYFSDESFPRLAKEVTFANDKGVELDVHWRLLELFDDTEEALSFELLWKRSVEVVHPTITYRVVAPDDLLMHVIVHGGEANPHRTLRWVSDAVAIMSAHEINWERFTDTAARGGWNVDVSTAFLFLKQHGFLKLPEKIEESLCSLPYTHTQYARYRKRATTPYAPLGRLPNLCRTYFRFDARGNSFVRVFNFFPYLAHSWGFERVRELVPFIWYKYQLRFRAACGLHAAR